MEKTSLKCNEINLQDFFSQPKIYIDKIVLKKKADNEEGSFAAFQ